MCSLLWKCKGSDFTKFFLAFLCWWGLYLKLLTGWSISSYAIHMQYYLNTNTEYKIAASMDNKNTVTEDLKTVHD